LLGTNTRIDIRRGTPVLASAIQRITAPSSLSATLALTERALTIAVDEISSHAGGIRVGDHVDVYYARSIAGEAVLVPLLQRVQVLGIGPDLQDLQDSSASTFHERSFGTVTLRVAATDAPRLLLAQQAGQISMLLRATGDEEHLPTRTLRAPELMQPIRTAAPQSAPGIELLIGGTGAPVPERSWLRVGERSLRGEST
jgi:pilus assembly protein CpaB